MPRSLTRELRAALYAQETADAVILLVTISHSTLTVPIRLSLDAVNTTSRGELFVSYPFDITLPDDTEDRPARAKLAVANTSLEITKFVRDLPPGEIPQVLVEIVRGSDPDTLEASFGPFNMPISDYNMDTVSGELTINDRSQEAYPEGIYSPADFPALFRRA